jgi:hypothetical protein
MSGMQLTTTGSQSVRVDVTPSALEEAGAGGVALTLDLHDGPLTLTAAQARELASQLTATAGR